MTTSDFLRLVLQLITPISIIVGLWIAARWLPDGRTWLEGVGARSFVANRAGQLTVWVVLGVLFAGPVADWVGVVGSAVQFALNPADTGSMSTVWGNIPFAAYGAVAILIIFVVYALTLRIGYRLWPEAEEEEETSTSSLAVEEWFVLLAIASLVARFVRLIILNLIWLPQPSLQFSYIQLILQLLGPISMIAGLWVAWRWMPALSAALNGIGAQSFVSNRAGRLVIWLALGAVFGTPLIDLSNMLLTAVQLLLGPLANQGAMSTVWGVESVTDFNKGWVLTTLVIYLVVGWIVYRLWPEPAAAEPRQRSTLSVEQVFLLLAGVSLVNQFIQGFVLGVIWLPIPNAVDMGRLSAVGLWGAWALGLTVVGVVVLVLYGNLRKSQSTS